VRATGAGASGIIVRSLLCTAPPLRITLRPSPSSVAPAGRVGFTRLR
jgi:hypothetical protein